MTKIPLAIRCLNLTSHPPGDSPPFGCLAGLDGCAPLAEDATGGTMAKCPKYRQAPKPKPKRQLTYDSKIANTPCALLGPETGDIKDCELCGHEKKIPLRVCNGPHKVCTPDKRLVYKNDGKLVEVAWCKTCKDKVTELPSTGNLVTPTVRNLLFHVYPTAGNLWRRNVEQILNRIDLFNGRRIVAIATDHTTASPEQVKAALKGNVDEILTVPNDPTRREVATFLPLFSSVKSTHPSHVTFFCHSKGVTSMRQGSHAVKLWTDIMYSACLDYWPYVEKILDSYPVAGAFKKIGRGWPAHESNSEWHFSGSFYWFRNRDVFNTDWQRIDQFWSGIEPWPSIHFRREQAGCIFYESPISSMNLYDVNTFIGSVLPAWEAWKKERAK